MWIDRRIMSTSIRFAREKERTIKKDLMSGMEEHESVDLWRSDMSVMPCTWNQQRGDNSNG